MKVSVINLNQGSLYAQENELLVLETFSHNDIEYHICTVGGKERVVIYYLVVTNIIIYRKLTQNIKDFIFSFLSDAEKAKVTRKRIVQYLWEVVKEEQDKHPLTDFVETLLYRIEDKVNEMQLTKQFTAQLQTDSGIKQVSTIATNLGEAVNKVLKNENMPKSAVKGIIRAFDF